MNDIVRISEDLASEYVFGNVKQHAAKGAEISGVVGFLGAVGGLPSALLKQGL
ncbi:hypothetical protein ACPOL_6407 [Acidisarcina polymorpha]|uniref:Uncharacterized protein n=1 Tax=Acidisarcina polymorpha TaxID=2211140 RepID=A0A2Z5G9W6_9BACT|nr:hypothetical protein ACPOL_6407 [Acidisarcina polymorpha]